MLIDRTLRPNPFQTYRDPKTGRWVTVLPQSSTSRQGQNKQHQDQAQQLFRVFHKASGS